MEYKRIGSFISVKYKGEYIGTIHKSAKNYYYFRVICTAGVELDAQFHRELADYLEVLDGNNKTHT